MSLKALRARLGLTQQRIAEELDVSQQTVARWEGDGSHIPSKYLKDLAIFLGVKVSELVQGTQTAEKSSFSEKKEKQGDDGDVPYGGVHIQFVGGEEFRKTDRYSYPVSETERTRLLNKLEERGELSERKWIEFETLDNRWVLVNPEQVEYISVLGDDVEAMPNFEHEEIYKAALKILTEGEPSLEEESTDESPYSKQLLGKVNELVSEFGGADEAIERLTCLLFEFVSGRRSYHFPERENFVSLAYFADTPSGGAEGDVFNDLYSEGYYRATYFRMSALRLIEVPLLQFNEAMAVDSD